MSPRVVETTERFGVTVMRFDSDLYLIESRSLRDVPLKLTFALYLGQDGAVMLRPIRQVGDIDWRSSPYRLVGQYLAPPIRRARPGDEIPRLERFRAQIGAKRAWAYLWMMVRNDWPGANLPAWRAWVVFEGLRALRVENSAELARRIAGIIDDLRQLLVDIFERYQVRPLRPR